MKKLLAVLVLVLFGTVAFAQWVGTSPGNLYTTLPVGNVGIGITAPTNNLHVYNSGAAGTMFLASGITGNGTTQAQLTMSANANADFLRYVLRKSAAGEYEVLGTCKSSARAGATLAFQYVNLTTAKYELRNGIVDAEFLNTGKLLFNNSGNVGIGTTNPLAKLSVNGTATFNGKVKCTEVEVLLAAWPDKVFKAGYNLMPLQEVETFVNKNNHLPGVPSEAEVLQNGVNVGDMNAVLLQKIEELTLYMIDLKKENDVLKSRIGKLEK